MRVRLPASWLGRFRKKTAKSTLSHGFVTEGLEDAFAEACHRLNLQPVDPPTRSNLRKSCGARVEANNGARFWLKISGIPGGKPNRLREREEAAAAITGVPRPAILKILDWIADGVHWRALQMEIARSPACGPSDFGRTVPPLAGEWFVALKAALTTLGRVETQHSLWTPERIGKLIVDRFGMDAPHVAEEWRTAHGDLNWTNLTAPELTLLDWEKWGIAPRGYDIAYLLVHSANAPNLVRRIEDVFAEDLHSPGGRVTRLLACAEMLGSIDAGDSKLEYRRPIEEIAQRALRGD